MIGPSFPFGRLFLPAEFRKSSLKCFTEIRRNPAGYFRESRLLRLPAYILMDAKQSFPSRKRVGILRVKKQIRFRCDFQKRGRLNFPLFLCYRTDGEDRVVEVREVVVEVLPPVDRL